MSSLKNLGLRGGMAEIQASRNISHSYYLTAYLYSSFIVCKLSILLAADCISRFSFTTFTICWYYKIYLLYVGGNRLFCTV